jgi:hypothetical protein
MLGFFALVSAYFAWRAAESGRTRDYAAFAIAGAAGAYTHLTMVFVVVGQAVALAAARVLGWDSPGFRWKSLLWALAGAGFLSAIAYAPFAPGLVAHLGADAPREAARVATGGWALAEALRSVLSGAGVPAALMGGVVALAGAISLTRRAPLAVALLVTPAGTAIAVVGLGQPIRPRFFFFLAGAAAIFVGRGLGAVGHAIARLRTPDVRETPVAVIVSGTLLLVAASAAVLPRNYRVPKQDFDGAVRFLEQQEAEGASIAAAGPACYPIDRYFGKGGGCLSRSPTSTLSCAPRALVKHRRTTSRTVRLRRLHGGVRGRDVWHAGAATSFATPG